MDIQKSYPHRMLMQVEKPGRYTGGEVGAVIKDLDSVRFCLCFPDVYEVGMSWSGLNILYYLLNGIDGVFCERAFAPWPDMEAKLRENKLPLIALETGDSLGKMDMLGFTIQHEMCYTNLLNMLDLSGVPLYARDRGEDFPIVCAGGPCACNPEPLADFIDFFYIGDAEESLSAIMEIYMQNRKNGGGKEEFLLKIAKIRGIYVPSFYDAGYNEDGTLAFIRPNRAGIPAIVDKAVAADIDAMFIPDRQIVPNLETVHDRISLEVFRGCIRGCRFCQAGYTYRPVREKSPDILIGQARSLLENTGHDEVSLLSLSTGDYSRFKELAERAMTLGENVSLSLPSLRVDAFSLELMGQIAGERKSGLTFAPEAGSPRLRDVINKNLAETEILEGCRLAFSGGWARVKLYFMLGLPSETEEDIEAIAALSEKIVETYYSLPKSVRANGLAINISASCFVPKPHTPFQFAAQSSYNELTEKQRLLKRSIRKKQVKFSYHNADVSVAEGAIARGDRRTGLAIYLAFKNGARFDSWSEHFNFEVWKNAFDKAGLDIAVCAGRERAYDEILPWDHINMGVSKAFLIKEMDKALLPAPTPNCRTACSGCGAAELMSGSKAGVCYECR